MDDIVSIIMELSEAERTLAENKWRDGGGSRSLEKRLTSADMEDEVETLLVLKVCTVHRLSLPFCIFSDEV